mmetsp:Transcript_38319/g.90061  ORF Transcript_38319/g.90061 Transcript_38319/m.90061 type:complete len:210 (-) Transcript_38319:1172-1801(-)
MAFQPLARPNAHWRAQREVDGEPAKHALGVRLGSYGDKEILEQFAMEVSCEAVHQGIHLGSEVYLSIAVIAFEVPVWVLKREARLHIRARIKCLVELHNIRCFKAGQIVRILHVVPQLRRRDRREVRSISMRDAYSVWCQEALCAIKTLRRQLVIREGAEQLAHNNVCLSRSLPESHVFTNNLHICPLLHLLSMSQGDNGIGIFLHRPH